MIVKKIISKILKEMRNLKFSVTPFVTCKWDYFTISMDYLFCKFFLKVSPGEYRIYNFPNLKQRYRKSFILNHHHKKYRNINIIHFAHYKYTFYTFLRDFYKRELILAPQCGENAFVDFFKKHQKIIIKPNRGSLGHGVSLSQYTDEQAARELFASFNPAAPSVCEEYIRQHPVMMSLNPHSVNTIRLVTLMVDGNVKALAAVLRMGLDSNSITDNVCGGGIGALVDVTTGIVTSFGQDAYSRTYANHPLTGTRIIGLQIPHWDQVIDLAKSAHKCVPQCALYGWDIAITESGVDIVEGNSSPRGTDFIQRVDNIPKGKELIPLLKKDRMKKTRAKYLEDWTKVFNEQMKMQ